MTDELLVGVGSDGHHGTKPSHCRNGLGNPVDGLFRGLRNKISAIRVGQGRGSGLNLQISETSLGALSEPLLPGLGMFGFCLVDLSAAPRQLSLGNGRLYRFELPLHVGNLRDLRVDLFNLLDKDRIRAALGLNLLQSRIVLSLELLKRLAESHNGFLQFFHFNLQ